VKPVVYSPDAVADLQDIGDYIATDNPDRARSFIEELCARAERTGGAPEAYPARDDVAPGLRMAVHGRYVILFRIRDDQVEVARILHGARDLRKAVSEVDR
jgi:toxin ParE1/3/4